jgi:hypothetical protein
MQSLLTAHRRLPAAAVISTASYGCRASWLWVKKQNLTGWQEKTI